MTANRLDVEHPVRAEDYELLSLTCGDEIYS
jgi:hypothetical protein